MGRCKLEIKKEGLFLGGEPFYLASGDMHYFRTFKKGWRHRLQLMKDFGLTAVQTYVPWNLHEPEEGQFCFDGEINLREFLELCDEIGLKVMFRPSVYMCAEWDLGGIPYWMLEKEGVVLRTNNEVFMKYAKRYYKRLAEEFIPYLSTNGGPIIAVAVENEYGSFAANNTEYIRATGDYMRELGVDVPLFTTNGEKTFFLRYGSVPEYWTGINVWSLNEDDMAPIKEFQPDLPVYIGEFWSGRGQSWECFEPRQEPDNEARIYKNMLEMGTYPNFFMFCGGTNYGFYNGANVTARRVPDRVEYCPRATSYDDDGLVTEYGEVTPKYFACKRVLKEYLEARGIPFTGTDDLEYKERVRTQSIGKVKFKRSADVLDNLENLSSAVLKSELPFNMEKLGQAYGFILYRTNLEYAGDDRVSAIKIEGLHDRAMIFGDGKYLGTYLRDRDFEYVEVRVPRAGMTLDILVENMGRVNFQHYMLKEKKGITEYVLLNNLLAVNWTNYSLPMKYENIKNADYTFEAKEGRPAIYSSSFKAEEGIDTFVDMRGWQKGVVYVNGYNIGRYWCEGPQETLYIPGEIVKAENTIDVLELHKPRGDMTVDLTDKPRLFPIANGSREIVS